MEKIGVTEASDPVFCDEWKSWVQRHRPAILITKNIKKLYDDNPGILNSVNVLVHATITGYGSTDIEPGVPKPAELLSFIEKLPPNEKSRITLRIDPIIPTENCVNRSIKIYEIGKRMGFRDVRVSVMDCYKHVFDRIMNNGFSAEFCYEIRKVYREIDGDFSWIPHAMWSLRKKILDCFPEAKVCCEPGFEDRNVPCVGLDDIKLLGIKPAGRLTKSKKREFCGCCSSKYELLRSHYCEHRCVYCYWKN